MKMETEEQICSIMKSEVKNLEKRLVKAKKNMKMHSLHLCEADKRLAEEINNAALLAIKETGISEEEMNKYIATNYLSTLVPAPWDGKHLDPNWEEIFWLEHFGDVNVYDFPESRTFCLCDEVEHDGMKNVNIVCGIYKKNRLKLISNPLTCGTRTHESAIESIYKLKEFDEMENLVIKREDSVCMGNDITELWTYYKID